MSFVRRRFFLFAVACLFGACSKITTIVDPVPEGYYRSIGYILSSDPQDSIFYSWIKAAGLKSALFQGGPFTAFVVPARVAPYFGDILMADPNYEAFTGKYHIVNVSVPIRSLPIRRLYPITTALASPFYVSKYLGYQLGATATGVTDTITTVNGSFLSAIDFGASNGFINTLSHALIPSQYSTLVEALSSDQSYVLFNFILNRLRGSPIFDSLSSNTSFTLFAPNDDAFRGFSYHGYNLATLENIDTANIDSLSHFVMWHVIRGAKFLGNVILESDGYDTVLTASTPTTLSGIRPKPITFSTLNGYTLQLKPSLDKTSPAPYYCGGVTVGLVRSPNNTFIPLDDFNAFGIPVGNGVLYKISSILNPR